MWCAYIRHSGPSNPCETDDHFDLVIFLDGRQAYCTVDWLIPTGRVPAHTKLLAICRLHAMMEEAQFGR
ncbi:hypothetical protein L1987_69249 [Smallanthus sonchifolius]|uniref:Uncharacterized protein n=1 Tax=Smallanthus sonchifolius TaxID=185202 RepID=A0ACB9B700_9ASTR|nr:hypothetical protein L1987_69249 [Smallanthus sonchifolius]